MKRFLCVLICICFVFPSFVFSSSAEDTYSSGTYLVKSKSGAMIFSDYNSPLDYDMIAPEGAYLTVIEVSDNFGYTVYDSIFGWIDLSQNCEYISSMPSITDKNTIEGVKGISVTRFPEKTVYIEGEENAELDGIEVSVIFNDGKNSTMAVSGYTVVFPDLKTYGEKKVSVYYGGFTTTFPISVKKVPVTGIVITKPFKTTYIEGESVSFDGLEVTAYYSDGRDGGKGIKLEETQYTVSGIKEGDSTLSPGTYEVTVTYKYPEIKASFHIYISEKSVTSLKLLKLPEKLSLYQGQLFDKKDFELSATYDNGITETITNFDIEYDNMLVGEYTARIYYMDKYVAFDYIVYELLQTGIELGATSAVGSYVGDDVTFSRLQVYAVYNSGEKKLTDNYELMHSIDTAAIGKYPVKVIMGDFTAEFEYVVAKRPDIRIGDVNFDGKVTASDARVALRAAAGLDTLASDAFLAADVNLDEKVNATDARKILRVAAGLDVF